MQLQHLWPLTPVEHAQVRVEGLTADSRMVGPGDVFVALRGRRHDARQFVTQAIQQGAVAVLAEDDGVVHLERGVPVLPIPDLPQRLGEIAARFYGQPGQALQVLAVTGTNGKTSTAQLLAHACDALGRRAAVLGTLGNGLVGSLRPSTHTTLDALQLQAQLAEFRDEGAQVVALEASSHGLEQGRLQATPIHTAIFTNLTRDHLDYHGTMEAYRDAKALLFRWPGLQTAILNADDPVSAFFRAQLDPTVRCWTYSQQADQVADFVALQVQPSLQGLILRVQTPLGECTLHTQLLGRFNVSNLLAVLAGLLSIGFSLEDAVRALEQVRPVRGRMDCLSDGRRTVVVDYAHTPDALEKVLLTLREHCTGELWCVFGCGGDRDTGKRPLMAEIAACLADRVLLTADNPRSEDPLAILRDMVAGIPQDRLTRVSQQPDRLLAIRQALQAARPGDLVLVAGKGHEDYQEIHGVRHPFDDARVVRGLLQELAAAEQAARAEGKA